MNDDLDVEEMVSDDRDCEGHGNDDQKRKRVLLGKQSGGVEELRYDGEEEKRGGSEAQAPEHPLELFAFSDRGCRPVRPDEVHHARPDVEDKQEMKPAEEGSVCGEVVNRHPRHGVRMVIKQDGCQNEHGREDEKRLQAEVMRSGPGKKDSEQEKQRGDTEVRQEKQDAAQIPKYAPRRRALEGNNDNDGQA